MILLRAFRLDDDRFDAVEAWYQVYQDRDAVRAELDARMTYLRQQSREGWTRPRYDILRKAHGVGEVRFKVNKINYRPLGYFGPDRNEFTFLLFATKTDRYEPDNAIPQAVNRMKLVQSHPRLSVVIKKRWGQ